MARPTTNPGPMLPSPTSPSVAISPIRLLMEIVCGIFKEGEREGNLPIQGPDVDGANRPSTLPPVSRSRRCPPRPRRHRPSPACLPPTRGRARAGCARPNWRRNDRRMSRQQPRPRVWKGNQGLSLALQIKLTCPSD